MSKSTDYIAAEFSDTLTLLIVDAAQTLLKELEAGKQPAEAKEHFKKRAEIYIDEKTRQFADQLQKAGDPITETALKNMQTNINIAIDRYTDNLIRKITEAHKQQK